ncbi:carboxypeptidase-like regulatory domain-containing protein [Hymenobacter norwichensis]|uniref:carboxypeptidase-like regulatory domain-containing protein n=1 Tax=Hymenobacter norwichensis TaxID=223903 RepID=UPI0003B3E874|nr:carboxypeptidase-like regulatory domain-containing protein [Hymenobacter norwichensis]
MKLTASPFDPQTGELLPVYRDAYLNGDLSRSSAQAVEKYLGRDADQAHDTLNRWQELHTAEAVAAPTWVQKQVQYIRAEPVRFRRRSTTIVAATALLCTMVFAGTKMPTERVPTENVPTEVFAAPAALEAAEAATAATAASSMRMISVRGRILNEDGAPLIGATVLHPGSGKGVSTNAQGEYSMVVPAGTSTLKYGYGGYQDEELTVKGSTTTNITLLPQAKQKRHWWQF